ncbi:TIGR01841 family phasin [Undibacterium arcticum]|uniref:TIGR01841 family phasin n=1 Tax=Undibacterium arcticum TaxID=1762892 RepID=A0ABV7EX34_9BURK
MFSNTEQYTSASKAFFESQLAALSALTSIAVHGTEKLVALNMEVAKASAADTAAAAKDLLAAKDPQAFFSLATAYTTPNAEKVAAYGRQLTDIVSATKAEFSKVADAQVAEVQSKISALVDDIAKNAPAGSENVMAMLKSSVANAHAGYEQMNSAAKQAVEATDAHVTAASDQLTQVVKKAAAK